MSAYCDMIALPIVPLVVSWFLVHSTMTHIVRISSPSCYQGVGKAEGTQVDIQSEEKSSSDCVTIYRKLLDHVTLSGTWYSL